MQLIKKAKFYCDQFFTSSSFRYYTWLHLRYGAVARRKEKSINPLGYKLRVADIPSFRAQFREIFVDEIYKFESSNQAPRIIDCGANIGTSCLYFKRLYPNSNLTAFEADPAICKILEKNVLANSFHNVEIINKAVWVENGETSFVIDGADGGSMEGEGDKITVSTLRLKDLIEKEEYIDLLKLDIEGAETDVLKDCQDSLNNIGSLFIEYHSFARKQQDLDIILSLIKKAGFRFYLSIISKRRSPFVNTGPTSGMDLQANIFAYRN